MNIKPELILLLVIPLFPVSCGQNDIATEKPPGVAEEAVLPEEAPSLQPPGEASRFREAPSPGDPGSSAPASPAPADTPAQPR